MRYILSVLSILLLVSFGIWLYSKSSMTHLSEADILSLDGPDKALLHNNYMLIDRSLGRVPYERLKNPKTRSFARNMQNARDFKWENINTQIPGRSRALYIQRSTGIVFSGAVTGGLWKNTDYENNESWEQVVGFDGQSVNCITEDPNNGDVLYLGTGESFTAFVNYRESTGLGNGIYKSTNGGENWIQLESTRDFYFINDIAVRNEGGMGVLYAAVGSGEYRKRTFVQEGLYRSTDGGESWTQVLPKVPGSDNFYQVSDIEISSNRIIVSTMRNSRNEGGSVVLTSEDGMNWSSYTGFNDFVLGLGDGSFPGRSIVKAAPSNPNHLYAAFTYGFVNNLEQLRDYYTEIWQSTDAGVTWSFVPSPGIFSIPWHALALGIDPNDENKIVAGGLELYVLNNTSAPGVTDLDWIRLSSWSAFFQANDPALTDQEKKLLLEKYVHADIHDIQFVKGTSNELLITTDGGVFNTLNMDITNAIDPENPVQEFPVFSSVNNSLNTTQFYHASIHPAKGRMELVGGTQDNGSIHQGYKPGIEFERNISGGDGGFSFFDGSNDNLLITMVYGNRYFIHVDEEAFFHGPVNGLFVNPVDYDDEANLIYSNTATSTYGGLYAGLKGRFYDSLEVFNVNKFLNTPDLGLDTVSFVKLNAGLQEAITAVRQVPQTNPTNKTVIVGTENGQVYRVSGLPYAASSTKVDGSQLPVGYISSVDVGSDEDNILVTISNFGLSSVWLTQDGGTSWIDLEGDLPDVPVRWGRFNPFDDNKIIIATELGIYGLENLAVDKKEWVSYNIGLPSVRVDMFDLRASDSTILAATHGHGIYIGKFLQEGETILGIENPASEKTRLSFYPNPVKDILQIASPIEIRHIDMYDLKGGLVLSKGVSENMINLGELNEGIFIVRAYTVDKKLVTTQRIEINR